MTKKTRMIQFVALSKKTHCYAAQLADLAPPSLWCTNSKVWKLYGL